MSKMKSCYTIDDIYNLHETLEIDFSKMEL